jgi:hypothetical protein
MRTLRHFCLQSFRSKRREYQSFGRFMGPGVGPLAHSSLGVRQSWPLGWALELPAQSRSARNLDHRRVLAGMYIAKQTQHAVVETSHVFTWQFYVAHGAVEDSDLVTCVVWTREQTQESHRPTIAELACLVSECRWTWHSSSTSFREAVPMVLLKPPRSFGTKYV